MNTSSTRQVKPGKETPEALMLTCSQAVELSFLKEKP